MHKRTISPQIEVVGAAFHGVRTRSTARALKAQRPAAGESRGETTMKPLVLAFGLSLALAPAASALTAKENFSYSTPSGMFSEGTFKWQLFRFIEEDQEWTEALRSGHDPDATGSIQGSATTNESVRRPGEGGRRRAQ
jgi:hypothetical protein